MADTIAIAMMAMALLFLVIAFIRLYPDLRAEARADAAEIRAVRARARTDEVRPKEPAAGDSER